MGDATGYEIDAGSSQGGNNYFQSGNLSSSTSQETVTNLPTNGSTVYVTLFTFTSNGPLYNEYTYTAASGSGSGIAQITSPTPGSTLTSTSQTFQWTSDAGATGYELDIGSVQGGNDIYQSGNLGNVTQVTVNNLPSNGQTLYVTLFTFVNGGAPYNQYTYTAYSLSNGLAQMTSPPPGSEIDGTSATFSWSAGTNAQGYELDIGSTYGGNDIEQSGPLGLVQSLTVNNLPNNGTEIYATLWTQINGNLYYNEYEYQSGPSPAKKRGSWKAIGQGMVKR